MNKTITNADILTIMQTMQDDIGTGLFQKKIPVNILFAMKYNLDLINEKYKIYESTLIELSKRYNAEIKSNSIKAENPEDQKKLNAELIELLKEDIDINLKLISFKALEKCGEGQYDALTFSEMERLNWFVDYEEEDKNKKEK